MLLTQDSRLILELYIYIQCVNFIIDVRYAEGGNLAVDPDAARTAQDPRAKFANRADQTPSYLGSSIWTIQNGQ